MPGDDGATPLQESMKQDYEHINKHATTTFILGQRLVKIIELLTLSFYL